MKSIREHCPSSNYSQISARKSCVLDAVKIPKLLEQGTWKPSIWHKSTYF